MSDLEIILVIVLSLIVVIFILALLFNHLFNKEEFANTQLLLNKANVELRHFKELYYEETKKTYYLEKQNKFRTITENEIKLFNILEELVDLMKEIEKENKNDK